MQRVEPLQAPPRTSLSRACGLATGLGPSLGPASKHRSFSRQQFTMRPATLPVELSAPCCSGRGVVLERPARGWQRRQGPVLASQPARRTHQQQQGSGGGRAAAAAGGGGTPAHPSTRTAAYAAGLGSFASSMAAAATATEAPAAEAAGQRQGAQQPPAGEAQRDSDGLLRNRPRPLKINLDLALVRSPDGLLLESNACALLLRAALGCTGEWSTLAT